MSQHYGCRCTNFGNVDRRHCPLHREEPPRADHLSRRAQIGVGIGLALSVPFWYALNLVIWPWLMRVLG